MCTFARVINIVTVILYIIFILPLYCLPEGWCCRKWLDEEAIDHDVMDYLKLN